jgi:hypothetical protein
LLTSSTWLDTAYGFELQKLFLNNFEIIAILESWEPWFIGARVTTAVTILHHQPDRDKRFNNLVKFVFFKKSLSDFLIYKKEDGDARATFDEFRDFIETMDGDYQSEDFQVRVVPQADLYGLGCTSFAPEEDEDEEGGEEEGEDEGS